MKYAKPDEEGKAEEGGKPKGGEKVEETKNPEEGGKSEETAGAGEGSEAAASQPEVVVAPQDGAAAAGQPYLIAENKPSEAEEPNFFRCCLNAQKTYLKETFMCAPSFLVCDCVLVLRPACARMCAQLREHWSPCIVEVHGASILSRTADKEIQSRSLEEWQPYMNPRFEAHTHQKTTYLHCQHLTVKY